MEARDVIPAAIIGVKPEDLEASCDEAHKRNGAIEANFANRSGIDAAGQKAPCDRSLRRQ